MSVILYRRLRVKIAEWCKQLIEFLLAVFFKKMQAWP